jgi:acyl-CoA synthetase (NDP forming)
MGIVAPAQGLAASISGGLEMTELTAGGVGLITSSGALGSCIATRLMGAGVGLSHWVHVGNEADLVIADFVDWLVDDEQTTTIGLMLEDIKEGDRLVAAGRRLAAAGKPTFVYNMGRSERGREAALSHTGAMLASFELREEIIRAAGMVSLPSLRVLEDALMLSSAYGLPRGNRLAAITFSGGAAAIIADEAVRLGVELPELSETTREQVRAHVPSYASVRNPMDTSFQMLAKPESFVRALIAMLEGDEFDAALVQFTTNADPFAERLAHAVVSARAAVSVPVYVSRFGGNHLAPRALKVYEEAGIPVLDAPDRATQAIGAVMMARKAIDHYRS